MAELVIITVLNELHALLLVVARILLFHLIFLLLKKTPLKVSHYSYVFFGEAGFVGALFEHLVSILVDFNGVAPLVLQPLCLNVSLKLHNKFLLVFLDPPLHAGIPVILDRIISSAFEDPCYVSPLIRLVSVEQIENPLFFARPRSTPLDHGIQVIVPAFSTLLSNSTGQVIGYLGPQMWSVNADQMKQ